MHPIINTFGEPISVYVLINHHLGIYISMFFYFFVTLRSAKRKNIKVSLLSLFGVTAFVVLVARVTGRLVYGLMYAPGAVGTFSLRIGEGSILFGGYLGAILALVLLTRFLNYPTLFWLDCSTVWMAFGLGINKIGCFLTGCCRGIETSLPWGVVFPGSTIPVHPLQLYESVFGFIIGIILWRQLMRGANPNGAGFFLFFSLFSLLRLVTLPIRAIPVQANLVALGPIAFLVLAVVSGTVYLRLTTNAKEEQVSSS